VRILLLVLFACCSFGLASAQADENNDVTYYCTDCQKPIELWTPCEWIEAANQNAQTCELTWGFIDSWFGVCTEERNLAAVVLAQKTSDCKKMVSP
jgi:hypothetical protein